MASVQGLKTELIAEALFFVCSNELDVAEIDMFWLLQIKTWGTFHK